MPRPRSACSASLAEHRQRAGPAGYSPGERGPRRAGACRPRSPTRARERDRPGDRPGRSPGSAGAGGPLATTVTEVIRSGTPRRSRALLREHPALATARLGDPARGQSRTLLHVVTDWPGHVPEAGGEDRARWSPPGADVNARFTGPHTETPLHWAASSDDVEALDALLDAGADIEADGAVIGGGTPIADAVAFGQWKAARRLLERGARTNLWQAAALGLARPRPRGARPHAAARAGGARQRAVVRRPRRPARDRRAAARPRRRPGLGRPRRAHRRAGGRAQRRARARRLAARASRGAVRRSLRRFNERRGRSRCRARTRARLSAAPGRSAGRSCHRSHTCLRSAFPALAAPALARSPRSCRRRLRSDGGRLRWCRRRRACRS